MEARFRPCPVRELWNATNRISMKSVEEVARPDQYGQSIHRAATMPQANIATGAQSGHPIVAPAAQRADLFQSVGSHVHDGAGAWWISPLWGL